MPSLTKNRIEYSTSRIEATHSQVASFLHSISILMEAEELSARHIQENIVYLNREKQNELNHLDNLLGSLFKLRIQNSLAFIDSATGIAEVLSTKETSMMRDIERKADESKCNDLTFLVDSHRNQGIDQSFLLMKAKEEYLRARVLELQVWQHADDETSSDTHPELTAAATLKKQLAQKILVSYVGQFNECEVLKTKAIVLELLT